MKIGLGLGIKRRLKDYFFRPYTLDKEIYGEKMRLKISDPFGRGWYENHNHWPELKWIKEYGISSGDIVVDCGANYGFTSIFFSKLVGAEGKVYAVEPLPRNQDVIAENLSLNEIKNCESLAFAAGSSIAEIEMLNESNGFVINQNIKSRNRVQVTQDTLDNRIKAERVDFLKLDVEGFELEALRGASRLLSGCPKLAIEMHVAYYEEPEKTISEILKILKLDQYEEVYFQPKVDGEIEKFIDVSALLNALVQTKNSHIFAK